MLEIFHTKHQHFFVPGFVESCMGRSENYEFRIAIDSSLGVLSALAFAFLGLKMDPFLHILVRNAPSLDR